MWRTIGNPKGENNKGRRGLNPVYSAFFWATGPVAGCAAPSGRSRASSTAGDGLPPSFFASVVTVVVVMGEDELALATVFRQTSGVLTTATYSQVFGSFHDSKDGSVPHCNSTVVDRFFPELHGSPPSYFILSPSHLSQLPNHHWPPQLGFGTLVWLIVLK